MYNINIFYIGIINVRVVIAGVEPDAFTIAVFQQLSASGEHKPAALARALLPRLLAAPLPTIPKPNLKVTIYFACFLNG